MNDSLGRPVSLRDLQNNDQDGIKRLESKLYLIRVSDDDIADLSACCLTSLPSEFYNLCRIFRKEIVNISDNRLKSLKIRGSETDLVKLNGILKQLNASSNLLKEVPCGLLSVHSLVTLDLSRNQISHIPSQITELSKLEELNLSENLISELPPSISNLVHLRMLDVSLNKIRCLPPALSSLTELEVLRIDDDKMELPPAEVCSRGLREIQQYLKDNTSGSKKVHGEKSIAANGVCNNKISGDNTGTSTLNKRFLVQSKNGKLEEFEREKDFNDRLKRLVQEQKELDDLVQNAFDKRSKDLKSILEDINELEKRTSALIESSIISCGSVKSEDIDLLRVEEILRKRRIELEKEQKEWLKSIDDEGDQLARIVYFEADQRRKRSMNKIALKIKEADLLANLRTEEGQNAFARICKEIAADQTLLEDFVLAIKERNDVNSRNLAVEAETIARALADISQLEMRRKNDENNAVLGKLKEERERMLMVYEQISAEKDFRRKQLYVDMQIEMEKEEESQRRIVAECLRRYAELMAPTHHANNCSNNSNNTSSPSQKSKLSRRLIPFSLLFSWKKRTEKAGKKALRDKLKDTTNASELKRDDRGISKVGAGACGDSTSLVVARYEEECVVCLDATVKVLIFPCGHVCCCEKCAAELQNCPLCRTTVQRRILLSSSTW